MSGPALALLLTTVVHIVGMALLIALLGRDALDVFFGRRSSGGDDGGSPPEGDLAPVTPPGGDGLPLPDAEQAPIRLREPGRLGERLPRRPRRPAHEPVPARRPERV